MNSQLNEWRQNEWWEQIARFVISHSLVAQSVWKIDKVGLSQISCQSVK